MKILQLTKKFPYPLNNGESIAIYNLTKGLLHCGAEVDLLSLNTSKHYTDVTSLNGGLDHYRSISDIYHKNDTSYMGAVLNLFSSESYHVQRLQSSDFEAALIEQLASTNYDVILLETIYMSMYLPIILKHSKAVICLRAHNIEYEIWRRCSEEETSRPKSWYLNLCANRLKKFETKYFKDYDIIAPITDRDALSFQSLGYSGSQVVVPVGLTLDNYASDTYTHRGKFCFIGSLDWMPNLQGLRWFVKEVWPTVYAENPDFQFHIAGKNGDKSLTFNQIDGVTFHGEVDSATEFIRHHGALIVPLFSGSGIRVKILEAMAMQRPVITTDIGLEGINAKDQQQVLIANTIQDYIVRMTNQDIDYSAIALNGKNLIAETFDQKHLAEKLYLQLKKNIQNRCSQQVST